MTIPPTAAGEQVFRRNQTRAAIGAIVLSAILPAIVLLVVPQLVPNRMRIYDRAILVIAISVVLVALVWMTAFWLRNIRVVVRPDTVAIGRPGKMQTFDRATTAFSSNITVQHTNGIRTGTVRTLLARTAVRETPIPLPGFTRATFNELLATLAPLTTEKAGQDPVALAHLRATMPTSFTVDASRERRSGTIFLIVGALALLVAVAFGAPALSPDFRDSDYLPLVIVAPLAAVFMVGFILGGIARIRTAKKTPRQLELSYHGLRIDGVDYAYTQLRRIWLTPPAYARNTLRLQPQSGRSTTYVVGSPRITMTPEYAVFIDVLRVESVHLPGLVTFDLE